MADFITKRENARRLAIIILCAIGMAVSLAVGIYAIKEKDFHEKGEKNPFSIAKLKPEVETRKEALKTAQDMLLAAVAAHIAAGGLVVAATHTPLGLAKARELRLGNGPRAA